MFQTLFVTLLDDNTTLSPAQKVKGPLAATVGMEGFGFTVTVVEAEEAVHPDALETVTEYVPLLVTTMFCVVAPVLQRLFTAELEESVTLPPVQNVTGPLAVTTGVEGFAFTVTAVAADPAVQPLTFDTVNE